MEIPPDLQTINIQVNADYTCVDICNAVVSQEYMPGIFFQRPELLGKETSLQYESKIMSELKNISVAPSGRALLEDLSLHYQKQRNPNQKPGQQRGAIYIFDPTFFNSGDIPIGYHPTHRSYTNHAYPLHLAEARRTGLSTHSSPGQGSAVLLLLSATSPQSPREILHELCHAHAFQRGTAAPAMGHPEGGRLFPPNHIFRGFCIGYFVEELYNMGLVQDSNRTLVERTILLELYRSPANHNSRNHRERYKAGWHYEVDGKGYNARACLQVIAKQWPEVKTEGWFQEMQENVVIPEWRKRLFGRHIVKAVAEP